jgi:hypothetical protein
MHSVKSFAVRLPFVSQRGASPSHGSAAHGGLVGIKAVNCYCLAGNFSPSLMGRQQQDERREPAAPLRFLAARLPIKAVQRWNQAAL